MGLIDFLKNIFKRKPKMLPEAKEDNYINSDWRQSQKLPYVPKVNTIDDAIYQYVVKYFSFMPTTSNHSYSTLTALNAITNQTPGNNPQLETILINKLKHDFSYDVYEQMSRKDDYVAFYHVSRNGAREGDVRLYINCKQKNIAMIVDEILTGMGDDDIYLKFISNQCASNSLRSESIVVYTNGKDVAKIVDVINRVSVSKPELFEDSDKANPFLRKDGPYVSVALYYPTDKYIDLNGRSHKIAKSYNNLLSSALEDSMKASLIDIVSRDANLTIQTEGILGDMSQYRKIFPTIQSDYMEELINGMKERLAILKQRNDLDIDLGPKNNLDDREPTI